MKKIIEVRYNWTSDEKAIPGFVYEQYAVGESQLVPNLEGEGHVWSKCEIIEEVPENGYHIRAHFANGIIEEQWNINKVTYTREAQPEYTSSNVGDKTGNSQSGIGRDTDQES